MKVLHINSNLSRRSGVMACIMNYYRLMDRNAVQFDFLCFDSRELTFAAEIEALGGKAYEIASPAKYTAFRADYKRFCREHYGEYDLVEIHDPFVFFFFARIKAQLGVKCVVAHGHSTKFSDHFLGEIRNRLLSVCARFIPDAYFACSRIAGETLFGKSRFTKKGTVIQNAINLDAYRTDREASERLRAQYNPDGKLVVGHIGSFNAAKNHAFMLDVFRELLKIQPQAELILVGDGEYRAAMEEKCRSLGIESDVLFLGARTDVPELLALFDVFFFPSRYEGLGIALVEAQAAGVPCVCSTAVPEEAQVAGVQALDLQAPLGDWVNALLSAKKDPDRDPKEALTQAGFSIEVECDKLTEQYRRLIQKCSD